MKNQCILGLILSLSVLLPFITYSQSGVVKNYSKISGLNNLIGPMLDNADYFGQGIANAGDIDNDGYADLVVGAPVDDDGTNDAGAVYVLFMGAGKNVTSVQKISSQYGGFGVSLNSTDYFGKSVASIGDLDNDGINEIAVGAYNDDNGSTNAGAVYILFLNQNGTVKKHVKVSSTSGNLGISIPANSSFGAYVAGIGDLDGDEVPDMVVGSPLFLSSGIQKGAVIIAFMNSDGTVKQSKLITEGNSGFLGVLSGQTYFGQSVCSVGDVNGDAVTDLAVGEMNCADGGTQKGAVWILFLTNTGDAKGFQKISSSTGDFYGMLNNEDHFGASVSDMGDFNNDGVKDVLIGAPSNTGFGKCFILFLKKNGLVKDFVEIDNSTGISDIGSSNRFGWDVRFLGDWENDGRPEIAVGQYRDDEGGTDRGAVYIISLDASLYSSPELSNNLILTVFPNPVVNQLLLKTSNIEIMSARIQIYNNLGSLLINKEADLISNSVFSIDVSSIPSGFYYYVISNNKTHNTGLFIK